MNCPGNTRADGPWCAIEYLYRQGKLCLMYVDKYNGAWEVEYMGTPRIEEAGTYFSFPYRMH
jgi:hypothetical protein